MRIATLVQRRTRRNMMAWQAHGKPASSIFALAEAADRSAMELGQIFDQGETDPQSALGAIRCPLCLGEQIEDMGLQLYRHANAIVFDRERQRIRVHLKLQMDLASLRRIFGSVIQ